MKITNEGKLQMTQLKKGSKKLIIILGRNVEDFMSAMRMRRIPFLRMKYAPVHGRERADWAVAPFARAISNIMCPDQEGEAAYVVVTGIRTHSEYRDFLEMLTNRCEYQILAFARSQIHLGEMVTNLEKFLHTNSFTEMSGVLLYQISGELEEEAS